MTKWTINHDSKSGAVWIEDETGQSVGVCDMYHKDCRPTETGVTAIHHKPDFAKNALLIAQAPAMRDALKEIIDWFEVFTHAEEVMFDNIVEILRQIEPEPCHPDQHVWVTDSKSRGLINVCIKCGEERA